MQKADLLLVVVYVGFILYRQHRQFSTLLSQSVGGWAGLKFAASMLSALFYTSMANNSHYRNGFLASFITTPIVLYSIGFHYTLGANLFFAAESTAFFVAGWHLVRKHQMNTF